MTDEKQIKSELLHNYSCGIPTRAGFAFLTYNAKEEKAKLSVQLYGSDYELQSEMEMPIEDFLKVSIRSVYLQLVEQALRDLKFDLLLEEEEK